ncbi:MAG: polyphosphate polymerase domain-containing protein [Candidatus Fimadaptatus sp.]
MSMPNNIKVRTSMVFERHEKKYLISEEVYQGLLKRLEEYMHADQYGLHTVCSLYLDSDDFILANRSMQKPAYKEKLRLRSYGLPQPDTIVYLELKKKLKGVTYKRRIPLTYEEAERYMLLGEAPEKRNQIMQEIDYFTGLYKPVPKILLFYERIALSGIEDEELRVTFDANIRWRAHDLSLYQGDEGELILPPGMRLMEIKIADSFPLWMSQMLSEFRIYPASFSKYCTAYKQLQNEMHKTC